MWKIKLSPMTTLVPTSRAQTSSTLQSRAAQAYGGM